MQQQAKVDMTVNCVNTGQFELHGLQVHEYEWNGHLPIRYSSYQSRRSVHFCYTIQTILLCW